MRERRAVFAGSFDPVTNGHLDLIERGRAVFGELVVAVGNNPSKRYLFPLEERLELVRAVVDPAVPVRPFEGLLVDFARREGCGAILRGLRGPSDLQFEMQMALANHDLAPGIETVFLVARAPFIAVSASLAREIAQFGGDPGLHVPPVAAARLKARFARPQA